MHQVVEIRLKLQILDDGNYRVALHSKETLAAVSRSFGDAVAELLLSLARQFALQGSCRHDSWRLRCDGSRFRSSAGDLVVGDCGGRRLQIVGHRTPLKPYMYHPAPN